MKTEITIAELDAVMAELDQTPEQMQFVLFLLMVPAPEIEKTLENIRAAISQEDHDKIKRVIELHKSIFSQMTDESRSFLLAKIRQRLRKDPIIIPAGDE